MGTLSVHLEGAACQVGCEFCYLGRRNDASAAALPLPLVTEALATLAYDELAVAVSTANDQSANELAALVAAAASRGVPTAVTTTAAVVKARPSLLEGVARLNLSVDPAKGPRRNPVDPAAVDALAAGLRARFPSLEVVLVVSLQSPEFADRLIRRGLLHALVDLPHVHKVALNALKPPPPWCDRAFWMRALAELQPLLARALDTRLFLDCYVAARLLGLGACPARADLSPASEAVAFRSCVYQPSPDFVAADAATLARRLRGFTAPAACPFDID